MKKGEGRSDERPSPFFSMFCRICYAARLSSPASAVAFISAHGP